MKFRLSLLSCLLFVLPLVSVAEDLLPRPPELEPDIQFWIKVYSQISTNEGYLHDQHRLSVIYETLHFDADTPVHERKARVEAQRARIEEILRHLASGAAPQNADEQKVRDLWGENTAPARFAEAVDDVRFQLGQADRFRAGLMRAGTWETHIGEVLANLGLPAQIAALPHVESSFDPAAYSKVGAAGLWQFMRSTGRRFMRIDPAVDERMDPFRATEAAAQLLNYNYRLLGTWPLAITAYNHGAEGMLRAREQLGTTDIVRVLHEYRSPTFGFASRNFYLCFLAALTIAAGSGQVLRAAAPRLRAAIRRGEAQLQCVQRRAREDSRRRSRHSAFAQSGIASRRLVGPARGARGVRRATAWLLVKVDLGPARCAAGRGETRGSRLGHAARQRAAAGRTRSGCAAGGAERLPQPAATAPVTPAAVVASAATAPASAAPPSAEAAASEYYLVQNDDTVQSIAARTGVTVNKLMELNSIPDADYLYGGQRLRLVAAAPEPETDTTSATLASAKEAVEESQEEDQAVAAADRSAAETEPVSAAQAQAEGPQLAPGVTGQDTADPVDYSVAADGTIHVVAAETLGHYADWLGTSAARLRTLNKLRGRKPVVMGHRFKLEFDRVTPAQFEQKRRAYHAQLQAAYFASHRIAGTEIYIARKGDSLWSITQRNVQVPIWLLQQYNPDQDFSDLRPGTQISLPKVEDVAGL